MNVDIDSRLVLVVGPPTAAKTMLSQKIQKEANVKSVIISHDKVMKTTNKDQSRGKIDLDYRVKFIKEIFGAIKDESNKLIIIDTLYFDSNALYALLIIIRAHINYFDKITLIKMSLPLRLHARYISERAKSNDLLDYAIIMSQWKNYNSSGFSLYKLHDLVDQEIKISDPKDILSFNFIKPKIINL